ncbi:MAG: MinD/ParA family protein [Holophagales bacterium]|jgi:flagellar biosynthesis protein FlhG|nr:MinD/ParA family protein [Holophagales bacterium]
MTEQAPKSKMSSNKQQKEDQLFNSRVIAITSGKGGVGKTNVVAGLATSLAKAEQRVVVLDADFGLANIDILLGLSPKHTLEHVLRGERVLEEIILEGPHGIRLIPSSSGIQEFTKLDTSAELRLIQGLQRIAGNTDWLLIDTAAGIHNSVIKLLVAAQEIILVSTPEPTSMVDAFAMVKVLHSIDQTKPIWLLINNALNREEAEETLDQIQAAAQHYLSKNINSLGLIPSDNHLLQAVRQQQGVVDLFPDSPAAKAFQAISEILMEKISLKKDGFNAFWKELSQV